MRINRNDAWNNGNKFLQGLKTRTRTRTRPQGPGQGQRHEPQGQGPDPQVPGQERGLEGQAQELKSLILSVFPEPD